MSKEVGSRSRWGERGSWGSVVGKVACYWSRRQTSVQRIPKHRDNAKNNATYEPGVPDSDEVLHYPLPPNTCPTCLRRFHICQSDTRAIDTPQSHPSNTIPLWELDPPLAAGLPGCEPRLQSSPKYSEFCGLPEWQCRFRFFIANEGEHFIHFCFLHFIWQWCIR